MPIITLVLILIVIFLSKEVYDIYFATFKDELFVRQNLAIQLALRIH